MFTNHSEMVATLVKPGEDIIKSLTPLKAHLWHMASCVLGEVGELLEAIAVSDNYEDIIEELGDIEFYLEGIRQPLHIERDGAMLFGKNEGFFGLEHITTKAGDLFDVIKKHVIYNKELDVEAVIIALNNMESCLENARFENNVEREETLQANLKKLNKRYAEGKFSDAQAQARADKAEDHAE